eukprot:11910749-Karenia_brevis.AAC.1
MVSAYFLRTGARNASRGWEYSDILGTMGPLLLPQTLMWLSMARDSSLHAIQMRALQPLSSLTQLSW